MLFSLLSYDFLDAYAFGEVHYFLPVFDDASF